MRKGSLLEAYVVEMRKQVDEEIVALTTVPFEKLYSVGKLQGRIEGLRLALSILDSTIEDQDN